MNIGELKTLIEDADDSGEVWIQVADTRRYASCKASIDDNGTLVFVDEMCYEKRLQ